MKRLAVSRSLAAAALVGAIGFCAGCQQASGHATREATITPPAPAAEMAVELAGVHNVVTYAPDVVGGGQPEGHEGLETLAAMGIKTIISVDGATPDVEGAKALGIRYVHLPISYDTVTKERQTQLAQAISSCDGPIYVHCHHGKHRSGAALGTALVLCGKLTPETAQSRMKVSGTAKEYTGLWKAVAEAKPLDASELKVDPATLPSVSKVSGMVATMAEIDLVHDLVKQAGKAKWTAPTDHPDLVPPKETKRLAALFAQLRTDPDSRKHAADYQAILQRAIAEADDLDAAVNEKDAAQADRLVEALNKSCKECHKLYRDV